MAIGRIIHYAVDAVMFSTVIAGIRRSSGFTVETTHIPDGTLRSVADGFLSVGETVFDMAQGTAVNSPWFKKDTKR